MSLKMEKLPHAFILRGRCAKRRCDSNNRQIIAGVEKAMTIGVEAVAKHAIYITVDQPTTGAQTTLFKDESEKVMHKEDTQGATEKPTAPIASTVQ